MRPGFWSPAVVAYLQAAGRQDMVDRGDALAQRVAALVSAASERLEQYLQEGDLYNGQGGASSLPALASGSPSAEAALSALDDFVNVRLRAEIAALENILSVFDDLRSRRCAADIHSVCDRLSSEDHPGVLSFCVGREGARDVLVALTEDEPGAGASGLVLEGHPFRVRRAPRGVRGCNISSREDSANVEELQR